MKKDPQGVTTTGIIGIIIGVVILAGAAYFLLADNSDSTNTNVNINAMKDDVTTEDTNAELPKDDVAMMDDANTNEVMNESDDDVMAENTNAQDLTNQQALAPGEYTTYSSQKFADASSKRRVLFFYASWCPTCRPADANITANAKQLPSDVVVFRADYDNESALKATYGVTYQHTFVLIDENGDVIKKWNGGDIDEILENVT